jgi:hypothetical protein
MLDSTSFVCAGMFIAISSVTPGRKAGRSQIAFLAFSKRPILRVLHLGSTPAEAAVNKNRMTSLRGLRDVGNAREHS